MKNFFRLVFVLILFVTVQAQAQFDFMVIGDAPYAPEQKPQFSRLIQQINQAKPNFVVHVGDIKGSREACSPTVFKEARTQINELIMPVIYTPGDNEWTDCHRVGVDPMVALGQIRKIFFPQVGKSLGQNPLPVLTQANIPGFASFVENQMWEKEGVLFATFHIVGSNNNLGSVLANESQAIDEFKSRQKANLLWLETFFAQAQKINAKGLVVVFHADPQFEEGTYYHRSGFEGFLTKLEKHLSEIKTPTLIVHGDSHHFRMDKPFTESEFILPRQTQLYHVTRVETFGSPHVHAVKVIVDFDNPNLFLIEPFLRKD